MARKEFYGLRGQRLQIAVGVLAGLGFTLFGYDQGVMGGLLTLPSFLRVFPETDTTNTTGAQNMHNANVQGATIGLYEIGCMFGALSCLWIGDMLGRRKTIFTGACIITVGAVIQTASYSLAQLIVGRIVAGVGNGMMTATVPTWQAECAPAHRRGMLIMIEGALITGGICISYWIDYAFFFTGDSQASWRAPVALQIVFALIIITFVLGLPESPRWLLKKGREEEAAEIFAALADKDVTDPAIVHEVREVLATLRVTEKGKLSDVFRNGKQRHGHRAFLGFVNQMFQQISGINLITYYAATIYQNNLQLDANLSRVLAACNGTEYFLASWIAVFVVERLGRRPLMLFGAAGQCGTMALLAGLAFLVQTEGNRGAAIAAAALLFVFNTFFAIGWLGMTWLYPAEIVSLEVRAPSNGISTAANWGSNFLLLVRGLEAFSPVFALMLTLHTAVAFSSIGYNTYTVFACLNGFILVSTYFLFPETAGRSLEQMDVVFEQATGIWSAVKIARDTKPMRHIDLEDSNGDASYNGKSGTDIKSEKPVHSESETTPTSAS